MNEEKEYEKIDIKVGSIVTITVDYPDGLDGVNDYVKGLIGVVTDFDEGEKEDNEPLWFIKTSLSDVNGYAYTKNQFRPSSRYEMETKIRELLM